MKPGKNCLNLIIVLFIILALIGLIPVISMSSTISKSSNLAMAALTSKFIASTNNKANSIKIPTYAQINADNSFVPWNTYFIVSSFAFPAYDNGNIIIPGYIDPDFNYTDIRQQQEKKSYNMLMNPF
jgi:hypothetical protein